MAKQTTTPTPTTPTPRSGRRSYTTDARYIAAFSARARSEQELREAEAALAAERAREQADAEGRGTSNERARLLGLATGTEAEFTAAVLADQARRKRIELLPVAIRANLEGREIELREIKELLGREIAAERLPAYKAALAELARAELAALDFMDQVARMERELYQDCAGKHYSGIPAWIDFSKVENTTQPRKWWSDILRWAESR